MTFSPSGLPQWLVIVLLVVVGVLTILVPALVFWYCCCKKGRKYTQVDQEDLLKNSDFVMEKPRPVSKK